MKIPILKSYCVCLILSLSFSLVHTYVLFNYLINIYFFLLFYFDQNNITATRLKRVYNKYRITILF